MVGLLVVNVIKPGVGTIDQATLDKIAAEGAEKAAKAEGDVNIGVIFRGLLLMLFTDNLLKSAMETQLLPIIVFAMVFASLLTTMGKRIDILKNNIIAINDALMTLVMFIMKSAPLGIFCLVTARFGKAQAEGLLGQMLSQTGWYMLTILTGLALHAFITLPLIFWFFRRENPYIFMHKMARALLTAFSTASSTATLPVTMECARNNAGISKQSVDFVLPLGATVNMDGTALYEAAAAIFIAQAIGMDLTMTQQIIIAVTATLAAIGAAGIPEAGLITMVIVLNAVNLPVEYIALLLSVDWLLDRFRTACNTLGDAYGAAIVDKTFPAD